MCCNSIKSSNFATTTINQYVITNYIYSQSVIANYIYNQSVIIKITL